MYEKETYEVILERMLNRVSEKLDKRPSSIIYDTHSATAIELQILYIELDTLIQNSFGDTAAREFLILLCKDRGITPKPATNAVLKGIFTPESIDMTGKRFNIGDMNYIVTKQIVPGEYELQCETAGEAGNQFLGQMIPMEYINGLETAMLAEVLIPGENDEDTEVLRQRYFDSLKEQAFGGNRADYLAKVRSIEGVGGCKVIRAWNNDIFPASMIPTEAVKSWYNSVTGSMNSEVAMWLSTVYAAAESKKLTVGGAVHVVIVDSDDYGEASTTLINKVQEILDPEQNAGEGYGLAPIGHVVSVSSALPVLIQVKTTVIFEDGYSWSNRQTAIEEAVNEYLVELRRSWSNNAQTIVRILQIETRILDIQGIVDVTDTQINGSPNNLIVGRYEIPVLGGVSA